MSKDPLNGHTLEHILNINNKFKLPSVNNFKPQYLKKYKQIIICIKQKREEYRGILAKYLRDYYHFLPLWQQKITLRDIPEVAFLLSSSRSGSSVTADMLKKQAEGSKDKDRIILCISGEEKPHLVLSGLFFPLIGRVSDELYPQDGTEAKKSVLSSEILGEIGYPVSRTGDFKLFAIQIYGRLLLQWPEINFNNTPAFLEKINQAITETALFYDTPNTYYDNEKYRTTLMIKIKDFVGKIDLRYYDGLNRQIINEIGYAKIEGPPSKYPIEESPFIIPKPWRWATIKDLSRGILLFKDPSNAWRINFWKRIFSKSRIYFFVLTRDPRETINGLCDGWKYGYGYQTIPSPFPLKISGYSDLGKWQKNVVNFSTNQEIWKILNVKKPVNLEIIAALQWVMACRAIIGYVKDSHVLKIKFESIRLDPIETIKKICCYLNVRVTNSLLKAANNFHINKVQVTPGTNPVANRWKKQTNALKIIAAANIPFIKKIARQLGYNY